MLKLQFLQGSLVFKNCSEELFSKLEGYLVYDQRLDIYRAKAYDYAKIISLLHKKYDYKDEAKQYEKIDLSFSSKFKPQFHQQEAFDAWCRNSYCGVIVLPTGSGKSFLAIMAIAYLKRTSLIVVPTIDLMYQWKGQLVRFFDCQIGLLGGGNKEIFPITIATYNSALIHIENIGNKFAFLICDEAHHLPSPQNQLIAKMAIAPFRLGLTATPERSDKKEEVLYNLMGGLAFRQEIEEMASGVLADYKVIRKELELDEDELSLYKENRQIYKNFLQRHRINLSSGSGWSNFIIATSRDREFGKQAFNAYLVQKRIGASSRAKIREIWKLLQYHKQERFLIFTTDNETAYHIGEKFFLPVLTYQTKKEERQQFLEKFRLGEYLVLVTSRVLNEGVDVPEVNVAIIVSGTGSVREHVQRLGRILRSTKRKKQAVLYELISKDTSEYYISERRRTHSAYQRPS